MRRALICVCCIALMLLAALCATPAAIAGVMHPIPGDPLTIETGKVSGTLLDNGVRAYLGVPFAAPPVRALRWHAPMPAASWTGIYNADSRQANCYEPLRASTLNHYFGELRASEDCLYANIWLPPGAKPGDHLPVVVWIYGGGFQEGSINFDIYSGQEIVKKGVIFMGIAYRVGIFGNLAHPELDRESGHNASGNWGLMDQMFGLAWIKRNIAAFGGDPANVTVIGQSAGAMSLDLLESSPLAKGLFAHVIALSGGYHGVAAPHLDTLAETEAQGLRLQQAMKSGGIAQMRTIPADQIVAIAAADHIRFSGPTLDGYVLPLTPADAYAKGAQIDVPLLLSTVGNDIFSHNEVTDATTLAAYQKGATDLYGADAPNFLSLYPANSDAQAHAQALEVARLSGFGIVGRDWARAQAATGKAPVWLVQFDHPHPYAPGVVITDMDIATAGAYHNSDLPYWYGTLDSLNLFRPTRAWTTFDRRLSDEMQDVIVAFARTGNPVTVAAPIPRYDAAREQRLVFGDTIRVETLNPRALTFFEAHPVKGK